MKITVIEYGGIKHYINCKSFEFHTNKVANRIKIKYQDGSQEVIYEIATIKAGSEDENDDPEHKNYEPRLRQAEPCDDYDVSYCEQRDCVDCEYNLHI